MPDILPEKEALKRAVSWISDHLKIDPGSKITALINEAVFRFDLNPMDANYLYNLYADKDKRVKDLK